jgi:small subunit ribosomal protein S17
MQNNQINETKKRKLIEAFVSSNKKYLEGTLTVIVKRRFKHPIYGKTVNASKKQIVDYPEKKQIELNTKVLITACAPISKMKRFRIVEVCYVN